MTTNTINKAAWLPFKQHRPLQIAPTPLPTLKSRQLLIKVHAVAINPVDAAIQTQGLIWGDTNNYPLIIGSDLAGEIFQIGPDIPNDDDHEFKIGDRVLACVEAGAFQDFCVVEMELVAKIPERVGFTQAVVLPLAMATAAVSLFQDGNMGLEMPVLEPKANGKVVLVWGASSSVGSCAVQLLRAAGYAVFATAGEGNLQYCKEELGAGCAFDYKSPDVESRIVEAMKASKLEFAGVFSAIIDQDVLSTCIRIADSLGQDEKSRVVGTVIPPGLPMFPLPKVPGGIRLTFCKGPSDFLPDSKLRGIFGWEKGEVTGVGPRIFGEWIESALESGVLRCKPEAFVVGKGLECVQEGLDLMAEGVSARKLVVEL